MRKPDHAAPADVKAARRYVIDGQPMTAPALAAGLFVVATPIGNLRDVTLRALEVLAAADLIACEDTRVTRKLLDHYGVRTALMPYHEHNAAQVRPKLIGRVQAGAAIALVSDAGTPLISDPGFKLVRDMRALGLMVTALPGASALLAALAAAGLPTDRFLFEGFLPPKSAARRAGIDNLKRIQATIVLYETGPRIAAALADLAEGLGDRDAAICRELTKLHEEVRRDTLGALARHYAGDAEIRGEFVIVIAPPAEQEAQPADLDSLLHGALARLSVKEAVSEVAAMTGQPRREIYQRALNLAQGRADDGER